MARYIQNIELNKPDDFVIFMMNDFIQKHGFTVSDWKGEPAYRAGDFMFEGYKYLKWSYVNGIFHLEAWIRGTFGGEWDLEGFVGCAQKGPYKALLNQLIAALTQPLPQPGAAPAAPMPDGSSLSSDVSPAAPAPTVIPVQTTDNHTAATLALVFGILSLLFFWSYLFCILFSVLSFSQARMGQGSSKAGQAKAGKICSIVGLCLMVAWIIVYVMINFASAFLTALS